MSGQQQNILHFFGLYSFKKWRPSQSTWHQNNHKTASKNFFKFWYSDSIDNGNYFLYTSNPVIAKTTETSDRIWLLGGEQGDKTRLIKSRH